MLEFPEVLTIAGQLKENIVGRKISRVLPPSKEHKFCFYNGEPTEYDAAINYPGASTQMPSGICLLLRRSGVLDPERIK